ncbi:hypothetical protein [Desulfonema magnum]|uniref:Uncharacterized protein n=1 Tax=Desulfonema magnum TaxID=45655 RepID=A0A975GML1_9BACT|nr:hypothetical protein [Desulfonema magnum]QTA85963.1 Uncharacterized protein dnm_019800 [Desulfonema magnum]
MILHAQVNEDGTLNAEIPKSLWGKRVLISIDRAVSSESSDWQKISEILEEADMLNFPRRSHDKILADLRAFRETE